MSELAIDPEAINRYVADRVLESALGDVLRKVVDEEVKKLSTSYNNPIAPVVQRFIADEVRRLITEEFKEQIEAVVRERVTEQFTADLLAKSFEAFERSAYR